MSTVSKDHIESEIRTRKDSTHSIEDQIAILHALWDSGIGPNHEGIRAAEIESSLGLDLDFDVGTSLHHLRDLELVDPHFKSHNEWHPVATWIGADGEILFGDDLSAAIRDAIKAIIDHMSDVPEPSDSRVVADGGGAVVRNVVADGFDYDPDKIDDYLRSNNEDAETLNKAVTAINENEDVEARDDYGLVEFIPRAYYYRLSNDAARLYNK